MLLFLFVCALARGVAHGAVRATVFNSSRIDLRIDGPDEFGGPRARAYGVLTFDVREVRGGNGDVAAAYLTAREWRIRFGFEGRILLVTHPRSRQILSRLVGRRVAKRDRLDLDLEVVDGLSLPPDTPPADLYVRLAARHGEHDELFGTRNVDVPGHAFRRDRVPVHSRTFRVTIPVFAASESPGEFVDHMLLTYRGVDFAAPAPGPSHVESGIYYDADAAEMSNWSTARLRDAISRGELGARLAPWLASDRTPVLAYGLSHPKTVHQFCGFLVALMRAKRRTVIFTPSTVNPGDYEFFDDDLAIASLDDPVPAEPAIVVVRLPDVSAETFNQLLALSRELPPVVSGDSSLSAALQLRRRFVMTQVAWNQRIAAELFAELASDSRSRSESRALDLVGRSDLTPSLDLEDAVFAEKSARLHYLTDRLLMFLERARQVVDESSGDVENSAWRLRRSIERLRRGEGHLELAQFGFPNTFVDAFPRALRLQAIDSRDLADPVIRESFEAYVNRVDKGESALLWAAEGGREDDIEARAAGIAREIETLRHPNDHPDEEKMRLWLRNALRALVAMGTPRAFDVVRDHFVTSRFHYTARLATLVWLNHLDDGGRTSDVADFLHAQNRLQIEGLVDLLTPEEAAWVLRPNVVAAIIDLGSWDDYRLKRLRLALRKWGDCRGFLTTIGTDASTNRAPPPDPA